MPLFPKNTCLAALKQNVHWPLLSKVTLPLVDGLDDHVVSCYITKGELGRYRQLCSTDGGRKKCERFPIDFRVNFPPHGLISSRRSRLPQGESFDSAIRKVPRFSALSSTLRSAEYISTSTSTIVKNRFRKYYLPHLSTGRIYHKVNKRTIMSRTIRQLVP